MQSTALALMSSEAQDEETINTGNEKLEKALKHLDEYNKVLEGFAKEQCKKTPKALQTECLWCI